MSSQKVLIICITDKYVENKCYESLINQNYDNYDILIHIQKYKKFSDDKIIDKYKNCSKNREVARKLALNSDAEYFLFVDSDIVLPENTINSLVSHKLPAVGGYYKMFGTEKWVCGRFVADNTFFNLRAIEPFLSSIDMAGFGCFMIRRDVLEKIEIIDGTNFWLKNEVNQDIIGGECLMFCNKIYDLGYNICMDGNVVCEHLTRENKEV